MRSLALKDRVVAATPRFLQPHWQRLEGSPLQYRLARGAFWSLAGTAISRALGLAGSIFVARMLGKAVYGELGIVQSTLGMFLTFAGLELGMTATKHVAELRCTEPERAGRIIGLSSVVSWISGAILAGVLFLLAPWLATHTLAAPQLAPALRIGSCALLLGAVNGAQNGALSGFEAFKQIAWNNFWSGLAGFPLLVGGVWWRGLQGALWGLCATQALNCLLSFRALRVEAHRAGVKLGWNLSAQEWGLLWRFSLPAVLASAVVAPANWLCAALIANQPSGYNEMAVYSASNQWCLAILFFPNLLTSVGLPMLANLQGRSNAENYRKVLRTLLALTFVASAAIAVPVMLLAPLIMRSYGHSFVSGASVLVLLCVVAVIMATLNVIGQTIASRGKMWIGFMLNAIWAVVLITCCFFFRTRGAMGLAWAYLAAYGVHLATVSIYASRYLKIAFIAPPK